MGSSLPHKCSSHMTGCIREIVESSQPLQLLYKTRGTTKPSPSLWMLFLQSQKAVEAHR